MTTKPSYIDRFSMIGDTIPMSKPPGAPGAGNRVYVGMNDTPLYSVGTRFHGFEEPTDSGAQNRPHWALAECVSAVYEKEIAKPFAHGGATTGTGVPVQYITPTGQVMYLGETGYVVGDLPKITDMLDGNWDELNDGSTPPVKIVVTAVEVQDPVALTWHSVYGVPLPADTTNQTILQVGVPNNNSVDFTGGLVGSNVGVSLINYDQWLRGLKSGVQSEIDAAFATITIDRNPGFNNQYDLHRNVATFPAAEQWQVGDTVFISHFVYEPRVTVAPSIPDYVGLPTSYYLVMGVHSTLGRLPTDAITALKVRTAEAVPYELERFILGGLDAAYDQLGFGTAGGGRTISVDSLAVFGSIQRNGETGFRAEASDPSIYQGTIAYSTLITKSGNRDDHTGLLAATFLGYSDAAGTQWAVGAACTGAAGGVLNLGAGQFATAGGDTELFLGLDLVYIVDGSSNPVVQPGSPDGIYKLQSIVIPTQATVLALDGTVPDLSSIAAGGFCTCVRPAAVAMAGKIGTVPGSSTAHQTSVFAARDVESGGAVAHALELDGFYYHTGALIGPFARQYVGNISRTYAVATDTFRSWGVGPDFSPLRYLGIVGATYNSDQVWSETIEKTAATQAQLMYQWEEATLGGCHIHLDAEEFAGAAPPYAVVALELYPLAVGQGLYDGLNYGIAEVKLGTTGDNARFRAGIWDQADSGHRAYASMYLLEATGPRVTFLNLIENPDLSGATIKKQPAVTTNYNANVDRCELENLTNYGFDDWQDLDKIVNLALGERTSAWTLTDTGAQIYWLHGGGANDYLQFPLTVPHGARIDKLSVRLLSNNVPALVDPIQIHFLRQPCTGGYTTVASNITVDPNNVAVTVTLGATYPGMGYLDEPVDLETYQYLLRIRSTADAGIAQYIYCVRVEFRWIDIFPE